MIIGEELVKFDSILEEIVRFGFMHLVILESILAFWGYFWTDFYGVLIHFGEFFFRVQAFDPNILLTGYSCRNILEICL